MLSMTLASPGISAYCYVTGSKLPKLKSPSSAAHMHPVFCPSTADRARLSRQAPCRHQKPAKGPLNNRPWATCSAQHQTFLIVTGSVVLIPIQARTRVFPCLESWSHITSKATGNARLICRSLVLHMVRRGDSAHDKLR